VNRGIVLTIILGTILVVAVVATVLIVLFPAPSTPFTELYLLGPGGKASNYPTNVTLGQTANVTVGVVNHENANADYALIVALNNKTINATSFSLANGQTWQNPISFTATQRGMGQKLEFDLYKSGNAAVYRSVYLYLTVT
jgi:uncharacterized membrane protein